MKIQELPYKCKFSVAAKNIKVKEEDRQDLLAKYEAAAALEEIREFIPQIDEANKDLLPVAFNGFVANQFNKNDDGISSKTATLVAERFVNKFIDIEHDRQRVVGVILSFGFSEFGTDKPMTKKQAAESKEPVNVVFGGVIWKSVSSELANILEETNDPESDFFLGVAASWEIGFSEFRLALIEGESRDFKDASFVDDEDEITQLEANLRAEGGDGKVKEKRLFREAMGADLLPLGMGLTENPAASVQGVATPVSEEEEEVSASKLERLIERVVTKVFNKSKPNEKELKAQNLKKVEEKISQTKKQNVKDIRVMKITSIHDINDAALKEVSASEVTRFIAEEISKKSEEFAKEQEAKANALKKAEEKEQALQKANDDLTAELKKIQDEVASLKSQNDEREAQDKFSSRMASFDEAYELTDDDRQAIASQIKDMTDEQYDIYAKSLETLLRSKNKEVLAEQRKKEEDDKQKKEDEQKQDSKASVKEETDKAIEGAKKEEGNEVGATTDADKPSLKDRMAKAFSKENLIVKV